MVRRRLGLAGACVVGYLAVTCAGALAAPTTIDFESGANVGDPITNQYASPGGVPQGPTFLTPASAGFSSFGCGPGHLTNATAHSPSDSVVLDGCGGGSEFAPTATFFSMGFTTDAVSFWIAEGGGIFGGSNVTVVTTAFDAQRHQVAQVVTPLGPQSGPTFQQVSLTSGSADIAFVAVELGSQNTNSASPTGVTDTVVDLASAPLYLDDLTYDPPAVPPNASFVLGASPPGTSTTEGGQAQITIPVTWSNNPNPSADPVTLSATTPSGVTASFSPNPTSTGSSTLTLDVAKTAPLGQGTVTVTGTFGSETEQVVIPFGISAPFQIVSPGAITLTPCTSKQVTLTVDTSVTQPIRIDVVTANQPGATITAISGPNGAGTVTGPSDAFVTVTPQNGVATATVTLAAGSPGNRAGPQVIGVQASSTGYPSQSDVSGTLGFGPSLIGSVSASGTSLGAVRTPQALQPGTTITITGQGFCPDSTVQFGNARAVAVPSSINPTQLQVAVPRLATSGQLTVLTGNPALPSAPSGQSLTVDSYRNANAWAFHNYVPSGFDLGELSDLFGVGQVYFSINPCWPFGTCNIPLFPTPTSGILLGIADGVLANGTTGGACFGFSLSTQRILENLVPWNDFGASGLTIHTIDSPAGPAAFTTRYINTQALAQFSRDYLVPYLATAAGAGLGPATQRVDAIRGEVEAVLQHGRYPMIALHDTASGGGHLVVAYDVENVGPHEFYIDVYDSNDPFDWHGGGVIPGSELAADGALHQVNVENSRVHVMPDGSWSLPSTGFSGGQADLVVTDPASIPAQPSMPTSLPGSGVYFGSAGSASSPPPSRTTQLTGPGGRTLYAAGGQPNTNPHTRLNAAPFAPAVGGRARPEMFVLGRGATDFRQTILGTRAGADSYTLLEGGTVERVDTHISKGVTDELGLEPSANTISFATSARHAPLTLTLSGASGAALHTATISTTSSRGGGDFLGFTRSRTGLSFVHRGAAATFTVTLSTLEHNGSPSTFSSGPLHIAPGQTAQIGGVRWDALLGSRLRVRIGGRTLTVVNRLRSPRLARIARLSVATARRGAVALTIRASIARLPRGGVVALAWIVRRGGRVTRVHTATVTVAHGTLSRTWTFRAPARGRYRLTARVMVLVPTGPAGVSSSAVTATAGFRH